MTKILFIEPDPVQRTLATILLNRSGFQVFAASGAEEAMTIARTVVVPIDVLLVPVQLPETDGPTLSDDIAALHPTIETIYTSRSTYAELPKDHRESIPREAFIHDPLFEESLPNIIRDKVAKRTN